MSPDIAVDWEPVLYILDILTKKNMFIQLCIVYNQATCLVYHRAQCMFRNEEKKGDRRKAQKMSIFHSNSSLVKKKKANSKYILI